MSTVRINGTKGAYLQPDEVGTDSSGDFSVMRWEGTRSEIESVRAQLVGTGCNFVHRKSKSGGNDSLEAHFSFIPGSTENEVPVNDWELFAAKSEKDVLETDKALVAGITIDQKRIIREAINNPKPGQSPALSGNALEVYLLMLNGVRAVEVRVPTLRHTQTVSNQWTIPASLTNVGSVISTGTLITSESVPGSLLFNLPTNSSSRTNPGTDISMQYGWMKEYPTVRIAPKFKIQIQQEWHYGLWSTLLYNVPL